MESKVFGVEATSKYLGISTSTLAKWRMAGSGPKFIKAGRRVLYREQDIEDWLSLSVHRSTSDRSFIS